MCKTNKLGADAAFDGIKREIKRFSSDLQIRSVRIKVFSQSQIMHQSIKQLEQEINEMIQSTELVRRQAELRNILQIVWQMREELNETGGAYSPDVDETLHGVGLRLQKLKENQEDCGRHNTV